MIEWTFVPELFLEVFESLLEVVHRSIAWEKIWLFIFGIHFAFK